MGWHTLSFKAPRFKFACNGKAVRHRTAYGYGSASCVHELSAARRVTLRETYAGLERQTGLKRCRIAPIHHPQPPTALRRCPPRRHSQSRAAGSQAQQMRTRARARADQHACARPHAQRACADTIVLLTAAPRSAAARLAQTAARLGSARAAGSGTLRGRRAARTARRHRRRRRSAIGS